MIPVEAVEAAGVPYEALVAASRAIDDNAYALLGWEGITRLLEVAAPYIRAQALEDAADIADRPENKWWAEGMQRAKWLRSLASAGRCRE